MAFLLHRLFFKPGVFFSDTVNDDPSYFKLVFIVLFSLLFSYLLTFSSYSLPFIQVLFIIIFGLVFSFIALLLFAFATYLLIKAFGGKAVFKKTFSVFSYASIIFLFFGLILFISRMLVSSKVFYLFLLIFILLYFVYHTYIMVLGLSFYHKISMFKSFSAYILGFIVYALFMFFVILIIALTIGLGFYSFSDFSVPSESGIIPTSINNIQPVIDDTHPRITSYSGSPAVIDGIISDDDLWSEGYKIFIEYGNKNYELITKHNKENIYLLFTGTLDNIESRSMGFAFYFEQDGNSHNHNLDNGITDNKYQGVGGWADAYWSNGWRVDDDFQEDGELSYIREGDSFVLELSVPLTGKENDIKIENYPSTIGFSIVDWGQSPAKGIYPVGSSPYNTKNWADIELVSNKR